MVCTPRSTCCQGRTNQAHTIQKARTTQLKCSACQQGKQGTDPAPAAADTIPLGKKCTTMRRWRNKSLQSSCRSANEALRNYNTSLKGIACKLPVRPQQSSLRCNAQKDLPKH